ncbi:MAG: OmpA family protein [Nevskia sp.]|nr:OmpA family protein [Gammaproteobacteria bacterium]MDH4458989.1 OmpA family protein [Nevskia sp.]
MNSSIKAGLLGASLLGIASTAQAQNRAEAWTLTPFVGGYLFDSKQDLESAPLFGIRAGYNFNAHVGAELFGSYALTESDRSSGPDANVERDVYRFGGNLLYHFQPTKKFVPFAAIGFGRYNVTVPDLNRPKTNKSLAEYGGGFKYFVSDDFALRADIRHVIGFSPSIDNVEYTFGVTWQIGGARAPLPVKVAEVAPVVCATCVIPPRIDTDGDGVEDALDKCPNTPKGLKVDSDGCVITQTIVLRAVNFVFDAAALTEPSKASIDEISAVFKSQPNLKLEVGGHTDSLGSDAYNLKLSQKRADAVKAYLVSKGVPAENVTAKGYGESRPISSNESPEGRTDNRRVEFRLMGATEYLKVYNEESSRKSKDAAIKPAKKAGK